MTKIIDYYYAPISGYAYLGEPRLVKIAAAAHAKIRFKPIDIALVFAASETTAPFKQSPARVDYRMKDLQRLANQMSLPIHPKPKYWPVPVELAATTIYAAIALGGDAHAVSFAILAAVYAEQKDVSDITTIQKTLESIGMDADAVLDHRASCEIQYQYESATQEAVDAGVFGSPTYVYNGELFFGQDRLAMLAQALTSSG